jgi:hypothetical protein
MAVYGTLLLLAFIAIILTGWWLDNHPPPKI